MFKLKSHSFSSFISLIRVDQWVKNTFVFLPMFFNKQFTDIDSLVNGCVAFFAFSLVSSSIYCFNDLIDVEFDKNHIEKKNRPIANGSISKSNAIIYTLLLALSGFMLAFVLNDVKLTYVLIIYFILNLLYTLLLKKLIIIDVFIIACSFVLRIVAGGVATHTILSDWIIVMVFLLALFLAFAKRRDEVIMYSSSGTMVRKNIKRYSVKLLNTTLLIIALAIIGLYIAYTLSAEIMIQFGSKYIYITSIFVILGILRYFLLIQRRSNYANPTKILLNDYVMQFTIIGWLISFYIIIY